MQRECLWKFIPVCVCWLEISNYLFFPGVFLTGFPCWCYPPSPPCPSQSPRAGVPCSTLATWLDETRRMWYCLTVPLAWSPPGKSCWSLHWRVIGAALPYFDCVGQGWTQVIDGLRVPEKSLSTFEIGGYKTREAGQESHLLGCSYQEGGRQRIPRINSHGT